ncbi:MAG: hypothetical protein PUD92_05925 [Clostridiales bacterium]|nr:hypothetical protein [Clostridiales bacterium]
MANKNGTKRYAVFVTGKCNKSNEIRDENELRTKLIRMISSQVTNNQ